jgi:hypothetical protein
MCSRGGNADACSAGVELRDCIPYLRISDGRFASCLVALILSGGSSKAQDQFGKIRGTVVITESDGSTSMIPGAAVAIDGRELSRKATADDKGLYTFVELPAGRYQIRASAFGLMGSTPAELEPGQSLDLQIVMSIENAKESVTVNGSDRAAITAEPEQKDEINRSTILNVPTKDDRADTLLPLIPGVVRGPDGLFNMKGARSSQAGALVNSASVVDPVTGNPAMSLPIDVVEAVTVVANPL